MYRNRHVKLLLALIAIGIACTAASRFSYAQEISGLGTTIASEPANAAPTEGEEQGLPQSAMEIARVFGFPVTNSMVVSWIVALGLIIFAQFATRRMDQVPQGAQNLLE